MKLAPIILCLILAGCATATFNTGREFDSTKVAAIQKGATTESEILSWFGQPYSRSTASDGSETLTYWTMTSHAKATSFIVATNVHSELTHKRLVVTLRAGKVETYSFSEGAGPAVPNS